MNSLTHNARFLARFGLLSLWLVGSSAMAGLIDDFDVAQGPLIDDDADGTPVGDLYIDAFDEYDWDTRYIEVNNIFENDPGDEAEIRVQDSKLQFASSADVIASGTFLYTFTNYDLTDGGLASRFSFIQIFADQLFMLDISVTDSADQISTYSGMRGPWVPPTTTSVPFSALVGAADLTDVREIAFTLSSEGASTSLDYEVDFVAAPVPAPGTLGLLGLGLVFAGFRRVLRQG